MFVPSRRVGQAVIIGDTIGVQIDLIGAASADVAVWSAEVAGRLVTLLAQRTLSSKDSLQVSNEITIVLVDVRGDQVRLGVQAASTLSVHRREVLEAMVDQRFPDSP